MEIASALSTRLRAALDEVPALVMIMRGPDLVVELANARRHGLPRGSAMEGLTVDQALEHAIADPAGRARLRAAVETVRSSGETVHLSESPVAFAGTDRPTYWDVTLIPLRESPEAAPDGVAVHATEVTRRIEARRRATEAMHRFDTLFEAEAVGVTISGDDAIYEANDAFLAMIGRTREELDAGLSWTAITAPGSRDADREAIESLRATGATAPYEKEYLRPDGSRVALLISGSRLSEEPLRVLATAFELTGRRRAEAEVATLLARTRRLQQITATLSASSSAAEIARTVVSNAIEELGASAGALVRGPDQRVEHAVGFDRELVEQWRAFPATLPKAMRYPAATPVSADELFAGAVLMAVPLVSADDDELGSVALVFRGDRSPGAGEADMLVALARQAGLALDRARLYENRAYVAGKLQEGLLPERLAEVPGLETAVVYESIAGGGEVGGDFYDLFDAGPGRWALAIGDVCGKGTEAAVVTGLARHTIRAVARMGRPPAEVLAFLNDALRRHSAVPAFCTVGCGLITAAADGAGFDVRLASGGHPFPLVLRGNGRLEEIEVTGTMLGVTDGPELAEVGVRLAPGDALVVYTDGVTDARPLGGIRFGEEALLERVRAAGGATAAGICEIVEAAVRAHLPGHSADDRALLVLRAAP